MNITILCVGKLKERYWTDAASEYAKRLSRYCTLRIEELKEEATPEKEGESLLRRIKEDTYVITLEIEGSALDSVQLSQKITDLGLAGKSNLVFVIGGSDGLSGEVKARADYRLSFSKMTFPHQLMRIILLEQIYRSFKIAKGETYHK